MLIATPESQHDGDSKDRADNDKIVFILEVWIRKTAVSY